MYTVHASCTLHVHVFSSINRSTRIPQCQEPTTVPERRTVPVTSPLLIVTMPLPLPFI